MHVRENNKPERKAIKKRRLERLILKARQWSGWNRAKLVANLSEVIKESSGQMDWAIIWYESVYNRDKTEQEKRKEMLHVGKQQVQEQGVNGWLCWNNCDLINPRERRARTSGTSDGRKEIQKMQERSMPCSVVRHLTGKQDARKSKWESWRTSSGTERGTHRKREIKSDRLYSETNKHDRAHLQLMVSCML